MAKQDKAKEDAKTFVPGETAITTINGDKVIVPKLNWGKELKLLDLVQSALEEVGGVLSKTPNAWDDLYGVVTTVLKVAPQHVTEFAAVVMEKDENWVKNNLDIALILGVIVPLLRERLDMIVERVGAYLGNQTQVAQALKEATQAATSETIQ